MLIFAVLSAILALVILVYWMGARSFGLAVPPGLEVFRMMGVGVALICFSSGLRIVAICAVSTLAPDRLGPWFFGGLPNDQIVFRPRPIDVVLLRGVFFVVLGPLLEELVFRGWAFRKWNKSWGFLPAALASSALFAAIHYDTGLIGPFVFGLVACKVYQASGNLLSPLVVHCTFNLIAMLTSIPFLDSGASTLHDATKLNWSLLPAGIAALGVGGGFSVWILVREDFGRPPG